jgi:hypothetical protein
MLGSIDKSFCVMDVVPTVAEPRDSKTTHFKKSIMCNA